MKFLGGGFNRTLSINVKINVKNYFRWFMLRPQTGHLEYYLMEENSHGQPVVGKHRASQQLVGTMVIPSDEDSQAFSVIFASGTKAL